MNEKLKIQKFVDELIAKHQAGKKTVDIPPEIQKKIPYDEWSRIWISSYRGSSLEKLSQDMRNKLKPK